MTGGENRFGDFRPKPLTLPVTNQTLEFIMFFLS